MVQVNTTGAVSVFDEPFFSQVPPVVVGDAPQWNDDSDATYAELETFENPDVSTSDFGYALLDNKPVTNNADLVTVTARVRYSSLNDGMARPLVAVAEQPTTSSELMVNYLLDDVPGSPTPTWVDIPLDEDPNTLNGRETFLERMNAGLPLYLRVYGPWLLNLSRNPRTRIYEAHLIVTGPTIARACRKYPGGIQGTVGGAVRKFPPQKYRQASGRVAGGCY